MCPFPSSSCWTTCRAWLLTCKCPWYILSTQSVSDPSTSGSVRLIQTWTGKGEGSRTGAVYTRSGRGVLGQDVRRSRQSGAFLLAGAETNTFFLNPGFDTEALQQRDVGLNLKKVQNPQCVLILLLFFRTTVLCLTRYSLLR